MKKHNARIARSGIQYYLDTELSNLKLTEIPREYKNQKVFSVYRPSFVLENASEKFKGVPVRVDHKWIYNTDDPAIIGHIEDDVKIKKNKNEVALYATLNIGDDENLPSYKELSPGYLSENRWQPGIAPDGEPYEILCTSIDSINHLAIVNEARGGKDMKILDGGKKLMIHSGLIRAVKKRLAGVFDSKDSQSFETVVDEITSTLQNIDDEELKAKTASLVGYCDDLPDSEEKEKLLRYIADIPLLKEEGKEIADEALSCIKESYKTLDADAESESTEKRMEEPKKDEQLPATPEQQKDEVPAPAEPEKKEDSCDTMTKIADALDAIAGKLDTLLAAKEKKDEPVQDEEKKIEEETKTETVEDEEKKPEEGVGDSLPKYTQSLEAINSAYNLDDAFAKLKGRR